MFRRQASSQGQQGPLETLYQGRKERRKEGRREGRRGGGREGGKGKEKKETSKKSFRVFNLEK